MAVRTITTKLSLENETEFKRQMGQVNSELRNLKSEMVLVEETFKGQANTVDALTEKDRILRQQFEQQIEKVLALKRAVEEATEAYGDADKRTDDYRRQLNYAETELIKLNRELNNNERYLDEAKNSADQCAHSIDEWGKEVRDSAGDIEDLGDVIGDEGGSGLLGLFGKLKGFLVGGSVVGGVKEIADAVVNLVDNTEEYRRIMGTLETSSEQAGYSAEQTKEAYSRLYEVLGDNQSAATTVANLQAIGLEQEDLIEIIDLCTGAWATYGDSIPIDSLAESINETIQAGKVTGVFADALNWAGTNEDAFNEKLAETEDKSERARIVLDELKRQGLDQTAQAWRENNTAIVEMHEAQDKWEQATANLATTLAPAVAKVKGLFADMLQFVSDAINNVESYDYEVLPDGTIMPKKKASARAEELAAKMGTTRYDARTVSGSHAGGLDYVPFDGYVAELHRGEAVLRADEAAGVRAAKAYLSAMGGAAQNVAQSTTGGVKVIELHTTMQMDKRILGEAVTEYQLGEERKRG